MKIENPLNAFRSPKETIPAVVHGGPLDGAEAAIDAEIVALADKGAIRYFVIAMAPEPFRFRALYFTLDPPVPALPALAPKGAAAPRGLRFVRSEPCG